MPKPQSKSQFQSGFGIGSDVAVQEYAALGCQITHNIFSEVGYRYLYDDHYMGLKSTFRRRPL